LASIAADLLVLSDVLPSLVIENRNHPAHPRVMMYARLVNARISVRERAIFTVLISRMWAWLECAKQNTL
jgi:hypothetical protein